jgi:hypothetical protein
MSIPRINADERGSTQKQQVSVVEKRLIGNTISAAHASRKTTQSIHQL